MFGISPQENAIVVYCDQCNRAEETVVARFLPLEELLRFQALDAEGTRVEVVTVHKAQRMKTCRCQREESSAQFCRPPSPTLLGQQSCLATGI